MLFLDPAAADGILGLVVVPRARLSA
jgi:hypothetical protein